MAALILNIETATTVCSVALAEEETVLFSMESNEGFAHAEHLTTFIQEVINKAGVSLNDLDAVSVSSGPGSYTGLRIGVSTAKGLCYALDKPLISVPTLKALAAAGKDNIPDEDKDILFCPMIDARRMEVYCAVYDRNLDEVQKTSAEIIQPDSFSGLLGSHTIYFFGDGSEKCRPVLSVQSRARFADNIFPSAAFMAKFAFEKYWKKIFEDVSLYEPYYLKDFVAGGVR